MKDLLVLAVVAVMLFVVIRYIVRAKKRGVKCIGCPSAGTCHKRSCGCHSDAR